MVHCLLLPPQATLALLPAAACCRHRTTALSLPRHRSLHAVRCRASPTAGQPKARELRGYTRAEVKQHTAEDDLWLIIKNKGSDRLKAS